MGTGLVALLMSISCAALRAGKISSTNCDRRIEVRIGSHTGENGWVDKQHI